MDALALTQGLQTTSEKIRVLNAAHYERSEIARLLQKRYQHVRNVLEDATAEQTRRAEDYVRTFRASPKGGVDNTAGLAEQGHAWLDPSHPDNAAAPTNPTVDGFEKRSDGIFRLDLSKDGFVRLPPEVMTLLGLVPGGKVMAQLDGEGFVLLSARENLRRIQQMVREYIPADDPSLVDELLADRRSEAAKGR